MEKQNLIINTCISNYIIQYIYHMIIIRTVLYGISATDDYSTLKRLFGGNDVIKFLGDGWSIICLASSRGHLKTVVIKYVNFKQIVSHGILNGLPSGCRESVLCPGTCNGLNCNHSQLYAAHFYAAHLYCNKNNLNSCYDSHVSYVRYKYNTWVTIVSAVGHNQVLQYTG